MKLTMPLEIFLPRKTKKNKRIPISTNRYRNAFHIENNEVKKVYKSMIREQLDTASFSLSPPVKITMTVYFGSKRRMDLDNWCSVQTKMLGDALVELGYITDDTTEFINHIEYLYGGIDKENPRVDVLIE